MQTPVIRCVLSGTYHQDQAGLISLYNELVTCGIQVLSPHRLDFDTNEEFVRDKAEHHVSAELIERHHLVSIKQSDFVWLHAPDGYVGLSAAFEIGYAVANHKPIFAREVIADEVLRPYIQIVPSVYRSLEKVV